MSNTQEKIYEYVVENFPSFIHDGVFESLKDLRKKIKAEFWLPCEATWADITEGPYTCIVSITNNWWYIDINYYKWKTWIYVSDYSFSRE